MHEPTLTPRALLRAVIFEVARERGFHPAAIEGNSRGAKATEARAEVAKRLSARGLPEQRIAHLMHLSVLTVQVYLGRRVRSTVGSHKEDVSP